MNAARAAAHDRGGGPPLRFRQLLTEPRLPRATAGAGPPASHPSERRQLTLVTAPDSPPRPRPGPGPGPHPSHHFRHFSKISAHPRPAPPPASKRSRKIRPPRKSWYPRTAPILHPSPIFHANRPVCPAGSRQGAHPAPPCPAVAASPGRSRWIRTPQWIGYVPALKTFRGTKILLDFRRAQAFRAPRMRQSAASWPMTRPASTMSPDQPHAPQ